MGLFCSCKRDPIELPGCLRCLHLKGGPSPDPGKVKLAQSCPTLRPYGYTPDIKRLVPRNVRNKFQLFTSFLVCDISYGSLNKSRQQPMYTKLVEHSKIN